MCADAHALVCGVDLGVGDRAGCGGPRWVWGTALGVGDRAGCGGPRWVPAAPFHPSCRRTCPDARNTALGAWHCPPPNFHPVMPQDVP
eukprot:354028-Chlamydomonas_euryale.AAC.11